MSGIALRFLAIINYDRLNVFHLFSEPCVEFLRRQADELGLQFKIEVPVTPKKPICIMTWPGSQPELKSVILNSHMDVVPVFEELWTHKPFDADIDDEGKIFARGSQDMKCVGMQYLGALRHFKRNKIQLKRTIHVVFVPEEEIGGVDGMREFIHQDAFRKLNAGVSLDEGESTGYDGRDVIDQTNFILGVASPNEVFDVYFAERSIWQVNFTLKGQPGHGSMLLKNTAGEKVRNLLDRFIDYRQTQVKRLADDPELTIGDVTTVNITMLNGGVQSNVVPPEYKMTIDMRLALDVDHQEFENMFKKWCKESGEDIDYVFEQKQPKIPPTKMDFSNIFWAPFVDAVNDL